MSAKDDLGALTIRNCGVVAQSYGLLQKINDRFLRFFNGAMPRILREVLPGWEFESSLAPGKNNMSFWPESWHFPDDKYVYFLITVLQNNLFWMNCLTGEDGEVGFAFMINRELFGDQKDQATRLMQEFYVDHETELLKHNFHQQIGTYRYNYNFIIIHPFKLEVDAIANEYPDWSDNVLQPFRELLKDIKACYRIFDDFVLAIAGPNELPCSS